MVVLAVDSQIVLKNLHG